MCCDICPYFDECEELDELRADCCQECPDYFDCREHASDEELEEAEPEDRAE